MAPVLAVIGRLLLGILGLILLLALLMCFSLRLRVSLISGELSVSAHYLFLRYRILPPKEKPLKKARKKKDKPKKEEPPPEEKKPKNKERQSLKGLWEQYLPLLRTAGKTVRRLCRRIVIYNVKAGVDVGGEDAHAAAIRYAKAASLAAVLRELLGEIFTLRIKYLRISPEFLHDGVSANLSARIRFRPIFALVAAVHLFFAFLKSRINNKSTGKSKTQHKDKGGRQYESAASNR
ncbi:MAG: hypothetical protein LBU86_05865 [Oscillospiraceae bacterium]|nr:hypothetical protein [Oscillospiraceae bacterium]